MKNYRYQSPRIILIYINIEHSVTNTSTASFMSGGEDNLPEIENWTEEVKYDQITF